MNIKIKVLSSAILMGISAIAVSADPPPVPGTIYNNGPQSPLVATTDLSAAERQAYALYEGVMQIAEGKIHATSCAAASGQSTMTTFTDGSLYNPAGNFTTVTSAGGAFTLGANSQGAVFGRGQIVNVNQVGPGSLAGTNVSGYNATVIFNSVNNMMVSTSSVNVQGINGRPDQYQGSVIKDFNRGSLDVQHPDYYTIFDWGLQSLSKLGYPVNKYWQRSKSRRDNGTVGRTVFVKDRLVGASSCRITIDTHNWNNQSFFWQDGTLKIEAVNPSTPVPAFNQAPFI